MKITDTGYGSGDGFWSHMHSDQSEMHLFVGGSGKYYNEELSLAISYGMLTYSKPYQRHYCTAGGNEKINFYYLGFCFDRDDLQLQQSIDALFERHGSLVLERSVCSQFAQIVQKSKTENEHIVKSSQYLLLSLLHEIAAHGDRYYSGQDGDLASLMLDMLHNNTYKKINLDDIARKMGFDKSYLIKIFKQKYQITPIKYLLKLKIDAAAYMLENSNLSIKEIAYRLKFYDEYYFSRKFKELKKLSPKEYRINCKNNYAASQQQNCFMLNA
jgi:AraC-like DNA-binding protein